MQTLDVKITIPDTHVLISVDEYESLKENELQGQFYTIKDLVRLSGKSESWLYDNLLNNPHRRQAIKSFTHFPNGKRDRWLFKAKELREYLDTEFLSILRR